MRGSAGAADHKGAEGVEEFSLGTGLHDEVVEVGLLIVEKGHSEVGVIGARHQLRVADNLFDVFLQWDAEARVHLGVLVVIVAHTLQPQRVVPHRLAERGRIDIRVAKDPVEGIVRQ